MLRDHEELIADIADLTGSAPPAILQADAPVLVDDALDEKRPMYLVGLIGGKDVGKSALVNALVGQEITRRTSHGPGTEIVVAYAHESQREPLKALLEREVGGQYQIVTHDISALRSQVLLDLPDIDSHYEAHIQVTRRMLRHMLYPIWIQSVEKYADQRPRELLSMVAAGNDPENFLFCLNKADQVITREGQAAADELRDDYAQRLARQLDLPQPARVFLISAIHPDRYELPDLRKLLTRERSEQSVQQARRQAQRRQGLTLTEWIDRQDLPQRLAAVQRLEQAAQEELAARVGVPLIERTAPRILDDPAYRLALADEVMEVRVQRWPLVNILHVILGPLVSVLRKRLPIPQQYALQSPGQLAEQHLREPDGGQSVATRLQAAFAQLQHASPLISRLYARQKLWEPAAAEAAEADLRHRLAETIERQRGLIRSRIGGAGIIGAFFRILLTVGALIWFPLLQPLLEAYLAGADRLLVLLVQLLSAVYLLQAAGFLAVWYIFLWLALKWATQRRVDRYLARWKSSDNLDPTLSLPGQIIEWTSTLIAPLHATRERVERLQSQAQALRHSLARAA